jgi:predicted Zn finger-like uncharacterized protein
MSMNLNCPSCQALFSLPDELAGRQLKCQRCGTLFRAPRPATRAGEDVIDAALVEDDGTPAPTAQAIQSGPRAASAGAVGEERDPDRRPRDRREPRDPRDIRRSRHDDLESGWERERRGDAAVGWIVGGVIGGIVVLGMLTAALWLMVRPAPVAQVPVAVKPFAPIAPAPPIQVPMPGPGAVIPGGRLEDNQGKVILPFVGQEDFLKKMQQQPGPIGAGVPQRPLGQVGVVPNDRGARITLNKGQFVGNFRLDQDDPLDPLYRGPCKLFLVPLEAGKTYVIEQRRPAQARMVPSVRVEKTPGQRLATDDTGDELNARLTFACRETGEHRVIATSLIPDFGEFTFTIRDAAQPVDQHAVRTVDDLVRIDDILAPGDPVENGKPYREYSFRLQAGVTYTIDLVSDAFDPYLRLLDNGGQVLRQDDDGGEGLNSRIVYAPLEDGVHRVQTTIFGPRREGPFTLTVRKGPLPAAPRPAKAFKGKIRPLQVNSKTSLASADDQLDDAADTRQFVIPLMAKNSFAIDVRAEGFTPIIKLSNTKNEPLAEMRGKEGECRLLYRAETSTAGRVHVSSADGKAGRFTITVRREP